MQSSNSGNERIFTMLLFQHLFYTLSYFYEITNDNLMLHSTGCICSNLLFNHDNSKPTQMQMFWKIAFHYRKSQSFSEHTMPNFYYVVVTLFSHVYIWISNLGAGIS